MRILRVRHGGIEYWARVVDEATACLLSDAPYRGGTETDRLIPLRSAELLAPVAPSKIVCIGKNYLEHAREMGAEPPAEPLLFMKAPSALLPSGGTVLLPPESQQVEYEGEIAVVLGARLSRGASREEIDAAVLGITCADDVTARDLQRKDVQFTRSKSFDTFCPIGPSIETEVGSLEALELTTRVNGEVRQRARAGEMVHSIHVLLEYVSRMMTLLAGDVILTGTPAGVGRLAPGDRVEVEIAGVGMLTHGVARMDGGQR